MSHVFFPGTDVIQHVTKTDLARARLHNGDNLILQGHLISETKFCSCTDFVFQVSWVGVSVTLSGRGYLSRGGVQFLLLLFPALSLIYCTATAVSYIS